MANRDRLEELLKQSAVVGIDFVYVHKALVNGKATLDVHFYELRDTVVRAVVGDIPEEKVEIFNEGEGKELSKIPIYEAGWVADNVLRLKTGKPKAFLQYRLEINIPEIDPYYNHVDFSFSAQCPSDVDCKPREHECPPEEGIDFPVDYRARDFWSFRRALLEFASQRYPKWEDQQYVADFGVMLAEVMSALGDELAYYQDRVAREAYLETATQRRSLKQHARLVDYAMHDGLGASTWLDVTVKEGQKGEICAGTDVWAITEDGRPIEYEVGRGLKELGKDVKYAVDSKRNRFDPHIWDEDDTCLPVGTREVFIKGHHKEDLPFDDPPRTTEPDGKWGKWVLLQTNPKDPAIPLRRWMVRVIEVDDDSKRTRDPVFKEKITHLVWEQEQALPFEMDLTTLEIHGNLVPITAGKTRSDKFLIGPRTNPNDPPSAVERQGPNASVAYRFSLPDSDSNGLVWLPDLKLGDFIARDREPTRSVPEISLHELRPDGSEGDEWEWRRSLVLYSQKFQRHFTLEDDTWGHVIGYQREGKEIEHLDYKSGDGTTIRFGDGEFGSMPKEGRVFEVTYRFGSGRRGNVSEGAIKNFDTSLDFIESVKNPLPVNNGIDPETAGEIKNLAPHAFRAETFRAVCPEDYAEAAERLPWVQRAGATFHWTGSWVSAFVTPDPRGTVSVSDPQRTQLINQLDRFRQAGREAHMLNPRYADIDLKITICVEPMAYRGEVKESVLEALLGKEGIRSRRGFFCPDNYTFGKPLYRSALEARIQEVPGVRAVIGIQIRRRGWFDWRALTDPSYEVGVNEVIRVENDPAHPEWGTVGLIMEGGA